MNELLKNLEMVENTVSDKEVVDMISKTEESYDMSHGSHNQHSSSATY